MAPWSAIFEIMSWKSLFRFAVTFGRMNDPFHSNDEFAMSVPSIIAGRAICSNSFAGRASNEERALIMGGQCILLPSLEVNEGVLNN